MTQALVQYLPTSLDQLEGLATQLARSSVIPARLRNPGDALMVMLVGSDYGFSPWQALRLLHISPEGRVQMSADAAVGLVKRAPCCRYFHLVVSTNEIATYETHRVGDKEPTTLSFTVAQAREAGLLDEWTKDGKKVRREPWFRFRDAMLRARASMALARAVYQDIVAGNYDPDELRDIRDTEEMSSGRMVEASAANVNGLPAAALGAHAPEQEPPHTELDLAAAAQEVLDSIAGAETEEALLDLWTPRVVPFKRESGETFAALEKAWKLRRRELRAAAKAAQGAPAAGTAADTLPGSAPRSSGQEAQPQRVIAGQRWIAYRRHPDGSCEPLGYVVGATEVLARGEAIIRWGEGTGLEVGDIGEASNAELEAADASEAATLAAAGQRRISVVDPAGTELNP